MRTKTIMLNKFFLGCSVVASALLTSCGQKADNDLALNNLQGKVKYLKENMYTASGVFGKVQKGERFRYEGTWDIEWTFNEDGNLVEEKQWSTIGENVGHTEYKYRKDNPKLKEWAIDYDMEGDPFEKKLWMYAIGKKGKPTETVTHHVRYDMMDNVLSSDSIAYDSNAKIRTTLSFNGDGRQTQRMVELMDGDNPVHTDIYDATNKLGNSHTDIFKHGLRDSVIFFNGADGKTPITTIGLRYDKYGNLIEQHGKDENGEPYLVEKYEYTYDKQGNWTQCIHYVGDDPVALTERVIKYYR